MLVGDEAIYQALAQSLQDSIPERWSSARIDALFYVGSTTFACEYTSEATGQIHHFFSSKDVKNAFVAIRRAFKDLGRPVWGRACFQLESAGEFQMQWSYEHCDENGDLVWDEARFDEFRREGRERRGQA